MTGFVLQPRAVLGCYICGKPVSDSRDWWCDGCDTIWGEQSLERQRWYEALEKGAHPSQVQRILHDLKLAFTNRLRRKARLPPLMLEFPGNL